MDLEEKVNQTFLTWLSKNKFLRKIALGAFLYGSLNFFGCENKSSPTEPKVNKPPETTIISEDIDGDKAKATFAWKGNDPDGTISSYKYYLIRGFEPDIERNDKNESYTYTNLKEGTYGFAVRAVDNLGLEDPTAAVRGFTIKSKEIPPEKKEFQTSKSNNKGESIFFNNFKRDSLNVIVKDQSTDIPVANIDLNYLEYATDNIFSIFIEDLNGKYFSDVEYFSSDNSPLERKLTENMINLVIKLKEANLDLYTKEIYKEIPIKPKNNDNFTFIKTVPLSQLYKVYKENDSLFKFKSILEFSSQLTNLPSLKFATKAASFREKILKDAAIVTSIIDKISSYLGADSCDPDAMYYDIYSHNKFHVLRHELNVTDGYCTTKGEIKNKKTDDNINNAKLEFRELRGKLNAQTFSDINGDFILTNLIKGNYDIKVNKEGFREMSLGILLEPEIPPQFKSIKLDFKLEPVEISEQDSLEGKIVITREKEAYPIKLHDIYIMDPNGQNQINLTKNFQRHDAFMADISKSNKIVAFTGYENFLYDIFLMNSDGLNIIQITYGTRDEVYTNPSWSFDEKKLVYLFTSFILKRSDVCVYDLERNTKELVTKNFQHGLYGFPSFSPNGKKIIYESENEIYILDLDTKIETRLTYNESVDSSAKWSPDGSKIAFISNQDVYVMDSDGYNKRKLTKDYSCSVRSGLTWSPDGNHIAFTIIDGDRIHKIAIMRADGSNIKIITEGEYPSWAP